MSLLDELLGNDKRVPDIVHYYFREKRLKAIDLTPDLLRVLLSDGEQHFKVENGVPPDAQIAELVWDSVRNVIRILFSHPSFDPVEPGADYPMCEPILEALPSQIHSLNEIDQLRARVSELEHELEAVNIQRDLDKSILEAFRKGHNELLDAIKRKEASKAAPGEVWAGPKASADALTSTMEKLERLTDDKKAFRDFMRATKLRRRT